MNSKNTYRQVDSPQIFNILNSITLIAGFVALFFLFTNGIPFVQLGWLPAFKGKNAYVNMMRVSVSISFFSLVLIYVKYPSIFFQLSIVKLVTAFFRKKLGVSLFALTVLYVLIMSTVSILRHLSGEGGDVAIFVQAIWNGTQGDFLYSSIKNGICLLGDHMSPVLAFVIPLYKLWPDPILTFILQAITIGSGLYLTGVIAREKLKSDFIALIFAIIYFFYFNARAALHYEFHPEALVEPFIFLAFIFLEKGQLKRFLCCLLIVILGKENMLGISGVLGLYIFVFKPWKRLGVLVMVLSVVIFILEIKWLMPLLSRIPYQYSYYAHSEWNVAGMLQYVLKIFSPFLFLPFFHFPTLLLTFPILFQNVFSQNELMRDFHLHYTIGLHPLLFISAIYGFSALCDRWKMIAERKNLLVCGVLWLSLLRSGPSEYFYAWNFIKAKRPYDSEMVKQIQGIGNSSSVLTQANFLPRLTNRKHLYVLDGRTPPTFEVIKQHQFDYILFDEAHWPLPGMPFRETFENLKAWGYVISFEKNGFYILKRA